MKEILYSACKYGLVWVYNYSYSSVFKPNHKPYLCSIIKLHYQLIIKKYKCRNVVKFQFYVPCYNTHTHSHIHISI